MKTVRTEEVRRKGKNLPNMQFGRLVCQNKQTTLQGESVTGLKAAQRK
jgi:hypothetical protein